jgi:hypothetical protein
MNQRDWVAVMALQGILANSDYVKGADLAARFERSGPEGVRFGRCDDYGFPGGTKAESEVLTEGFTVGQTDQTKKTAGGNPRCDQGRRHDAPSRH